MPEQKSPRNIAGFFLATKTRLRRSRRNSAKRRTISERRAHAGLLLSCAKHRVTVADVAKTIQRCSWAEKFTSLDYIAYHDEEWGVPVSDDRVQFEFLILEGAQAGLSWSTILNKRAGYERTSPTSIHKRLRALPRSASRRCLTDPGIVRNRLKVESAVSNAKAFLDVQEEFGSFSRYIWRFVESKPKQNRFKRMGDVPATSAESDALSKDLKKRGFRFVGSTIIYAHMQATGLVNDHLTTCFRYKPCAQLAKKFSPVAIPGMENPNSMSRSHSSARLSADSGTSGGRTVAQPSWSVCCATVAFSAGIIG